jgi:mannose-6-phosphate isomerase-like protein (cupin superfamily)
VDFGGKNTPPSATGPADQLIDSDLYNGPMEEKESYEVVGLKEKFELFDDLWSPKIVAQLNDYHVKIAKVQGEFEWHSHPETDELFLVVAGRLVIELPEGPVELGEGDLYVVPKGVQHKPVAKDVCQILMLEPTGTINTGDAGGERTVDAEWI